MRNPWTPRKEAVQAHSKSEYKRLKACGYEVLKPIKPRKPAPVIDISANERLQTRRQYLWPVRRGHSFKHAATVVRAWPKWEPIRLPQENTGA